MAIKKCKDLEVYNISVRLAMEIYWASKKFPKEELYSLVDQIRRSSRSVPVNIREGYAKRRYIYVFTRHLNDALGSLEETIAWLYFTHACGYLSKEKYVSLRSQYEKNGAMIYRLMQNWEKFPSNIEPRTSSFLKKEGR